MPITFLNGTAQDHADFAKAQAYLMNTTQGQFLFAQAWSRNLEISFNNDHNDSVNNNTLVVSWDPRSALQVVQPNGEVGAQSPALGLLHEMYHWYTKYITGQFDEYLATEWEKGAALSLGEPVRNLYTSDYSPMPVVRTYDVTAHADKSGWKSVQNGEIKPGPQYDPHVQVITPGSDDSGGGGDSSGGSGSGGSVGGGGGGTFIGNPQPVDPDQPTNPGFVAPSPSDYVEIEIIGAVEPFPIF